MITDKTGRTTYKVTKSDQLYTDKVKKDHYERVIPVHAHGTGNIDKYTNNTRLITDAVLGIYDRVVGPDLLIRRVNVVAAGLIKEKDIPPEEPVQLYMYGLSIMTGITTGNCIMSEFQILNCSPISYR